MPRRRRSREKPTPTPVLPAAPRPPRLRKGSVFAHPLGRMRVLRITGWDVTFTYADDTDGEQYPRRMERDAFDRTYGSTR